MGSKSSFGDQWNQAKPPIRLPELFQILSWTPDDLRLVIYPEDHTLWVINVDGSGLQQVVYNRGNWEVLPNRGN